jgi:transposase-like protein
MALDESAMTDLLAALRAGGGLDVVGEALGLVLQALIDAEATEVIGADRYQRSTSRTTHRNGTRPRLLSTKAGDVDLRIPKLREGSFFPALLEPRRRIDRALLAVVMEAYVHGTPPARSTTWSRPWASTAASPSPRSAGSVPNWTARSQRFAPAPWPTPPCRMCSWTRPTSRPGWMVGSSPGRW